MGLGLRLGLNALGGFDGWGSELEFRVRLGHDRAAGKGVCVGVGVGEGAGRGQFSARVWARAFGPAARQARTANIEACVADSPPPPDTAAMTWLGSGLRLGSGLGSGLGLRLGPRPP